LNKFQIFIADSSAMFCGPECKTPTLGLLLALQVCTPKLPLRESLHFVLIAIVMKLDSYVISMIVV